MLPTFLKSNFWFVKFNELDLERDKEFIIFQILNYGGFEDWKWLFSNYPHDVIRRIVGESLATAWFSRTLYLWQKILNIEAKPARFPDLPPKLWV